MPPRIGRPARSEELRQEWTVQVEVEWKKQGRPGWRPVKKALPEVPTRVVQEEIRRLKGKARKAQRERVAGTRVSAEVVAREAIWAKDATHVGREGESALETQVVKDRGTLTVIPVKTGPAASGKDIVESLKALKEKRGLPLVLSTDNGSCYVNEEVEAFLRDEKVVHLKSLPRTPEHNSSAEVAIRELKETCEVGKGTRWEGKNASTVMESGAQILNENRLRGSKGYKTSSCLDKEMPVAYLKVDRAVFYEECVQRQAEARAGAANRRQERMREREAIWETLEKYGLVKRTRGVSQH